MLSGFPHPHSAIPPTSIEQVRANYTPEAGDMNNGPNGSGHGVKGLFSSNIPWIASLGGASRHLLKQIFGGLMKSLYALGCATLTVALLAVTAPIAALATAGPQGGVTATAPVKDAAWLRLENSKIGAVAAQSLVIPYTNGTYSRVLPLVFTPQQTTYFCVPASGQAMLSNLIGKVPSQTTLANLMGTTSQGTSLGNVPSTLNNLYSSATPFIYDTSVTSSGDLFNRVVTDVDGHSMSQMLATDFGELPWRMTGDKSGHAIVSYGWFNDTLDGVTGLYVWGPWDGSKHQPTSQDMFTAIGWNRRGMIW